MIFPFVSLFWIVVILLGVFTFLGEPFAAGVAGAVFICGGVYGLFEHAEEWWNERKARAWYRDRTGKEVDDP